MKLTIEEISNITGCRIEGRTDIAITGLAFMKDAKKGDLVLATEEKYFRLALNTEASAILTNKIYDETDKTLLISENANESFIALLENIYKGNSFHSSPSPIEEITKVAESAKIGFNSLIGKNTAVGENCIIHPNVYIGADCKIGNRCIIYPNTTIYDGTVIGNDVIIHGSVIIGADGFGYEPSQTGLKKYPHIGYVEISDQVEIGANTCIDRAKIGKTFIGYSTKIDNLCQIAHNVTIGSFTVICGQTGVAGSSSIGNQCVIGAQVGVADHVTIDDNCIIGAKSGITKYIAPGSTIMGNPSHPVEQARRIEALKGRLPETHKEFKSMKKKLEKIENELKDIIRKI